MLIPHKSVAALAVAGALVAGGVSIAAGTATSVTVEPVASLKAGDIAPFDAAGVKAIRRGKAIPAGYVLVGQKVTNTRGIPSAGAALYFRCPDGKRLKTFGTTGTRALAAADRPYVDHKSTWVRSAPGVKGEAVTGTAYAVCR